jgi:Mce-associated membrane protein
MAGSAGPPDPVDDAAPESSVDDHVRGESEAVDFPDVLEDAEEVGSEGEETEPATVSQSMSPQRLATVFGSVAVVVLAGIAGWVGYQTYQSHQAQQQRELFLQVARQGALNLTTIDWQHADSDVQRVLDSATGTFREDFAARSKPFVEVVKRAKSQSVGSITEAGVESINGDEAQVMLAMSVKTTMADQPESQPRAWRMRLTVQKVGSDEAKVSNVVFVP